MVSQDRPALMLGCWVGLAVSTIGLGFLADADGADHWATFASAVVAAAVLCGGPSMMAAGRRPARRMLGQIVWRATALPAARMADPAHLGQIQR
jgi:hypothetical protein